MSYQNKEILRDKNNRPIPQIWSEEIDDFVPYTGKVTLAGSNLALRNTIATGSKTVTSTAAEIFAGSSRLAGRHAMVITNVGVDHVYIGASGVTTSNGFPLFPQDTLRIEFDPTSSVGVFACTSGPNVQVRVVELS